MLSAAEPMIVSGVRSSCDTAVTKSIWSPARRCARMLVMTSIDMLMTRRNSAPKLTREAAAPHVGHERAERPTAPVSHHELPVLVLRAPGEEAETS